VKKSIAKFDFLQQKLGSAIGSWELVFRIHATRRMFERDISEDELMSVLLNGQIIETYPNDKPFPSVLVNGISNKGKTIHVVISKDIESKRLYIVTVYVPNSSKWTENFSRRVK
jgi:hypothetical protein